MTTRIGFASLSLMDALDLAFMIEKEAYQRYLKFAAQFGVEGPERPGHFFRTMAENEAKHGKEIAERRHALFGATPSRVTLDDLFDVEAPEEGAVRRTMSVMQAFQVGIAAEQKAYDFYDQALKHITDPDVSKLFVELRDEETEHVRLLRDRMEKLPPGANIEGEINYDETPYL
jgi:rubrerythrin